MRSVLCLFHWNITPFSVVKNVLFLAKPHSPLTLEAFNPLWHNRNLKENYFPHFSHRFLKRFYDRFINIVLANLWMMNYSNTLCTRTNKQQTCGSDNVWQPMKVISSNTEDHTVICNVWTDFLHVNNPLNSTQITLRSLAVPNTSQWLSSLLIPLSTSACHVPYRTRSSDVIGSLIYTLNCDIQL